MSRRFASFQRAADLCGVHYGTIRNKVIAGQIEAVRLPGRKGWYVDFDQAKAVVSKRAKYGSLGPDAKTYDLSNVADFEFEVM